MVCFMITSEEFYQEVKPYGEFFLVTLSHQFFVFCMLHPNVQSYIRFKMLAHIPPFSESCVQKRPLCLFFSHFKEPSACSSRPGSQYLTRTGQQPYTGAYPRPMSSNEMPLDLARNGPAAVHPRRHPLRRLRHRRQGASLRRAVGQLQVPDRGTPPPRGQPRVVPRGG